MMLLLREKVINLDNIMNVKNISMTTKIGLKHFFSWSCTAIKTGKQIHAFQLWILDSN